MSLLLFIWLISVIVGAVVYFAAFSAWWFSDTRKDKFKHWNRTDSMGFHKDYNRGEKKFFSVVGMFILAAGMTAAGIYGLPVVLGAVIGYAVTHRTPHLKVTSFDEAFLNRKGK